MKNMKAVILVVLSIALIGALVYLTLLIQDNENPLGMFGIRASNPQDELDPFLAENDIPSDTAADNSAPLPTDVLLAYNSTSPTVTPGAGGIGTPSATLAVSISPSPTPTETPSPTPTVVLETADPSPTPIQTLPVSGITDNINKILIGGGVLILLGLLL